MKIGDFVMSEYNNGEIVNGEIVKVKAFGDRTLVTVKAEQGYRSIYLDKCITFDLMETAN
jgi:DNA-directed RNA polymerase subunit E'/Rpb7